MKKLSLLPFLILFYLSACGLVQDEPELIIDPSQSFVEGEWRLVKSIGSMINITLEGDDLKRIQVYEFSNDGTFKKSTKDDNYNASSTGPYEFEDVQEYLEENYIGVVVLTFTGGNDYAENCSSEEKEYLHISKEGQLVNISSAPCDGPVLLYEKLVD